MTGKVHCCTKDGQVSVQWVDLCVRLDVWHFMRRLADGCTSESHPLYMLWLSVANFEWDRSDLDLLIAKRLEFIAAGVPNPPETAVQKAVSKEEIARHCRRTRDTK